MKMVIFTLVIAILVIDWLVAILEFATGHKKSIVDVIIRSFLLFAVPFIVQWFYLLGDKIHY